MFVALLLLYLSFVLTSSAYIPGGRSIGRFERSAARYRRFANEENAPSETTSDTIDISKGAEGAETSKALSLASKGISILKVVHENVVKQDEPKQSQSLIAWRPKSARPSAWTRTQAMRRLSDWAFEVCDVEGTGRIDKRAFYTGMLLVHLNIAKYAGAAACSPMNRTEVDHLFELADQDRTGLLNKQEFTDAIIVSTARISSRLFIYWALILFAVPMLVRRTLYVLLPLIHPKDQTQPWIRHALLTFEWLLRYFITLSCFSVLVPQLFSRIDMYSSRLVRKRKTPKSLWEQYFGRITEELTTSTNNEAKGAADKQSIDKTRKKEASEKEDRDKPQE